MVKRTRSVTAVALVLGCAVGLGALGGTGQAQVPGVPGTPGTPGTPGPPGSGGQSPPPPPPPVADPGPLGEAVTHAGADAARRGAIASGGLRPPLRSLWRQDFDALVSAAVVGDGRAYVRSGTRVTALDLATGKRLWTSAAQVGGSLAFASGKVVTSGDGTVALDAATGAVAWSVPGRSASGGAPLIAGDLVIVQNQGLVAFDLATGAQRWRGGDRDGVSGAPAAAGDRIFQFGGCTASAVDRRSGAVIWRRNSGCSGGTSGTVALQGDKVHSSFGRAPLAAADGRDTPGANADILAGEVGLQRETDGLAAVSLTGGQLLWRVPEDDSVINDTLGAPLVMGDSVFQTRFEGTVEARALTTGAVTWRGKLRGAKETFTGSTSASGFDIAGGNGVLLVLRGSTIDALGAAAEPPRSLAVTVPRLASRQVEALSDVVVRGGASGDLLPTGVVAEADPFPFGGFAPAGKPGMLDEKGRVSLTVKPDRNVRVRLTGADGSAQPTQSYTLFAYPRIRFGVRNLGATARARVTVRGSSAIRYRGRRVSLYIARAGRRRMTKLGSGRLTGPRTGRGATTIRFRTLDRVGRRDFLFACVPGVHRLGQGAADPVQRRCGRTSLRY